MTLFEQKTLIEVVLYVLQKTQGVDYYHLFKILYFADRKHIAEWGSRITADSFAALQYGPVPSCLYDVVKGNSPKSAPQLKSLYDAAVRRADQDAPNVLLPRRDADLDYLSESERAALDESIEENAGESFCNLMRKSHDIAWQKASVSGTSIDDLTMAEAGGASSDMMDYIAEQKEIDRALA